MNIPNLITIFRLIITPFVALSLYQGTENGMLIALLLFLLGCISDTIDGAVARSMNLVSQFGAILDHTADKMLIVTTLLSLVFLNYLQGCHIIPVFVIISRDLVLGGLREAAAITHIILMPNWIGKTKTIIQMVAITLIMSAYFFPCLMGIGLVLLWAAALLAMVSFISYMLIFNRQRGLW